MKQPKIKSMKYEDFKDNEYLEQLRANGTDIIVGCLTISSTGAFEFGMASYFCHQLLWY